jgi:tetratricopeptide (TPR) repeat protein
VTDLDSQRTVPGKNPTSSHGLERLRQALSGRYQIEQEIGAGGMAVVYRARESPGGRQVAIKVLLAEVAATVGADRFLREIRIASELEAPNIVPIYDSGRCGDDLYYVMPYVEGRSLRAVLERRTFLPIDEALRLATEVGEALDFAHQHGIVHRDIKPENILIDAGRAMLADFGIARAIDVAAGDSITSGALVIGTPVYMSPEQGSGQRTIDGRSDLYSLACVVYEMLAGAPPFHGPTPEAIQARKTQEPMPAIRTVRPAVPEPMEDALRRALAVIPADRFATAGEFVRALGRPPDTRRRRARVLAVGVLLVLALAIILLSRSGRPAAAVPARLVVAEFSNRTGDSTLDAVGFMAADWLTEGLQRAGAVEVVPTLTAMEASRFLRGSAESTPGRALRGMREETGADVVVTGSYYRSGDTLALVSQITDVRTGRVLTSIGPIATSVANPVAGVAQLRTRAMGYLASTMDERLASSAGLDATPPTYEAYQEFSVGMLAYASSDFATAATHLLRAFVVDSSAPTPLLFASISLSNQGRYGEADSVAQILAGRRNALNPFYQTWLDYRLAFLAGDRPRALAAVRRLASQAPRSKATYNLAVEALENGYLDEAIRALKSLPPDRGPMRGWLHYWELLGTAYHLKGDLDSEKRVGEEARRRYPDRPFALLPSVRALAAAGDTSGLDRLLGDAARLGSDRYGVTLGSLLREAADEALAHGRSQMAARYYQRSLDWYLRRLHDPSAAHSDSVTAANLLYAVGRWQQAEAVLHADGAAAEEVGLRGLLAARMGRVDEARAIANALGADRRPHQLGAPFLAQARVAGLLLDTVLALSAVREAFSHGRHYDLWIHRTPELAILRSNPAFRELVRAKP